MGCRGSDASIQSLHGPLLEARCDIRKRKCAVACRVQPSKNGIVRWQHRTRCLVRGSPLTRCAFDAVKKPMPDEHMFIRHRLFCFLVLRQARMLFRPTDRALGKPAELVMRVERLRGVRTDAAARLRLRVLDATVGRRCVRVSLRLFRCNGLCALAALRCRCADARVIRRCRAVAAAGECGGSQGCGSGDQQGGDKILVHDVLRFA